MSSLRDTIAKDVLAKCKAESGFSGEDYLSAWKVADWYLDKIKGSMFITKEEAKEFVAKHGRSWDTCGDELLNKLKRFIND